MRILLDINEFEVESAALVGQSREVLTQQTTLTSVQLRIPMLFNSQDSLLPKFTVQQESFSLLQNGHLCL